MFSSAPLQTHQGLRDRDRSPGAETHEKTRAQVTCVNFCAPALTTINANVNDHN